MLNFDEIRSLLLHGLVIPEMPLVLDEGRQLDECRQRALVRYYSDAGAGGLAVGTHTTQYAIRAPGIDLFERLLALVSAEIDAWSQRANRRIVKIAEVCGLTEQARREVEFAQRAGYDAVLLNLAAFGDAAVGDPRTVLGHCRELAALMPLVGFCAQPAAGGRALPHGFWRAFAEIENVLAITIAPFNRYQTLDVARAVCMAGREREIALYTGNDDNIVVDLLTEYAVPTPMGVRRARIVGACSAIGPCGRRKRSRCSTKSTRSRRPARRCRKNCSPAPRASPTATPRSSTPRTISPDASPACILCSNGKGCSPERGCSTHRKSSPPANSRTSPACTTIIPNSTTTPSCAQTWRHG